MTERLPPRIAIIAVAVGAALGALLRHGMSDLFPDPSGTFPWTTFAINVSGSFVLALLPLTATIRDHPFLPPALGTGVLGGFTTMSGAIVQTHHLYDGGHVLTAALYVVGTFAAAIIAVAIADQLSTVEERLEFEEEEGDL